ncbi:MAG: MFS transporter [Bryobacteraceae bacterium]|nr:MFS transporter [Bryobacteraceae bacterium]
MTAAVRFIVLLGVVSLFADVTYEGARGALGPYLALLGAGPAAVGFVSGAGELLGHALRLGSGWLADRTRAYWALTIAGYTINLLAVPLLAFAGNWPAAAVLVILERSGKALRTPARDAMLSRATEQTGHGWGFGLHEALDQVGALTGPLIVAVAVASVGYRTGFLILGIPALAALAALAVARRSFPIPPELPVRLQDLQSRGLPRSYWLYLAAAGLMGAGFLDFPLIAWRLAREQLFGAPWIAALYGLAMGVDALAALAFGRLFDRYGPGVLALAALCAAAAGPLVLLGGTAVVVAGVALWGIALGAQESVLRAAVATLAPPGRRASAYGIFHTVFGVLWFAGSLAAGALLAASPPAAALLSATLPLAAIPILLQTRRLPA